MDGCSFVSLCVCVHNLVCELVLVDLEPQPLVEQLGYIALRVLHFSAFHYKSNCCIPNIIYLQKLSEMTEKASQVAELTKERSQLMAQIEELKTAVENYKIEASSNSKVM